jgi:hypothetical protein
MITIEVGDGASNETDQFEDDDVTGETWHGKNYRPGRWSWSKTS